MIETYNLRSVKVVFHPSETILEIDHTDEHAANPETRDRDFALLIHGVQPKGSNAAKAIRTLKSENVEFSYSA
jgi:hypothetical protein